MYDGCCNQKISISISADTLRQGSPASEKPSAVESKNYARKEFSGMENGTKCEGLASHGVAVETIAARRIQTAFRAYKVWQVEVLQNSVLKHSGTPTWFNSLQHNP